MNELSNFKNFLELGEKIQDEINLLQKENAKLLEENKNLLAERNNLLVEMNNLLAENERLRKVNETFGKNLQQIPNQFQFIIRDELKKFFESLSLATENNFNESENEPEENNSVVPFENGIEILDAEENLPDNIQNEQPKKKMIYAEFYAEESLRN